MSTTEYIAVKHIDDKFGEWSISPKEFFATHGYIPDTRCEITIPGMEEITPHTFKALDGTDGRQLLIDANIEIDHDADWYYTFS